MIVDLRNCTLRNKIRNQIIESSKKNTCIFCGNHRGVNSWIISENYNLEFLPKIVKILLSLKANMLGVNTFCLSVYVCDLHNNLEYDPINKNLLKTDILLIEQIEAKL